MLVDKDAASLYKKFLEEKFLELEGRNEKENLSDKFSRSMNTLIEDAREQGYHDMGKLNKMVADQIANQALNFREKTYLTLYMRSKRQTMLTMVKQMQVKT